MANSEPVRLDPKTTKHRLLECSKCHEVVASSAWSGRALLRCASCSFEEERELSLDTHAPPAAREASESPYRDAPKTSAASAAKLELGVGDLLKGFRIDALTAATLRESCARTPLTEDARADAEWERVWVAVWLAWMTAIKGDPLRARVALETALVTTTIPAYRSLLLAHLAQHAASLGATALAKKWLGACEDVGLPEIESEVRAARAFIALAKGDLDDVFRLTGYLRAGDGFKGYAVVLAIALNLEARERNQEHHICASLIADLKSKDLDAAVSVPLLAFQLGRETVARLQQKRRRTSALIAAVVPVLVMVLGSFFRDLPLGPAILAGVVAGAACGAISWGTFGATLHPTRGRLVAALVSWLGPIACTSLAALWLVKTAPPPRPAPPSPPPAPTGFRLGIPTADGGIEILQLDDPKREAP